MRTPLVRSLAAVWLALVLAPAVLADRLVTHDGRILEVKKARQNPDGSYRLVFENGEITCPAQFVASVEIEGDMSDYVPQNEDEKKKLADGYVRYRGKWMIKATYQAELNKEAEARRKRTEDLAAHASFHSGWETETKHFQFKSNTSPDILEHYADLLEGYYELMDQRVGIDPSPTLKKKKMKVSVYKSREEFQKLTRSDPGVLGFFNFVDGELHFFHEYQEPSRSEWVALHEGTHLLTYLIEPRARPWIWINEGVADYFGSSTVSLDKKGKLKIEPGQLQVDRVLTVQQAIKDGEVIPLEKLFFISRDDYHGFEYAHGWSFVYFLNSNPAYEKGFKRFFKEFYTIGKGVAFEEKRLDGQEAGGLSLAPTVREVPPAEVRRLLLDKLGVKDVPKLEKEWLDFIAAIQIDAPAARFKRGLFTLFQGNHGQLAQALEDIEGAIEGGVVDPRADWARGVLQLVCGGEGEKCVEDFRRAIELSPLNAGFRNNLGQLLSGMSLRTGSLTVSHGPKEEELNGPEEGLEEARRQIGLSCELEPENDFYKECLQRFLQLSGKKAGGSER